LISSEAGEELFEKGTRELLALDHVPQPRPDGHQNLLPGISVPDLKDLELAKVYLSQVMNKRPGHVNVTTEAGYCNFCGRPRNLRSEEHQLGNFVRTVVTVRDVSPDAFQHHWRRNPRVTGRRSAREAGGVGERPGYKAREARDRQEDRNGSEQVEDHQGQDHQTRAAKTK